jgi:sulfide:quinone oxidoreductase
LGSGKTILVLGSGFGGLAFVNEFRRIVQREHRVVLISKKERFSLGLCNLWLMVGERRSPAECEREVKGVTRKNVEFVNDEVVELDPREKRVKTRSYSMRGDYIVVALGADYDPGGVPGLDEALYNIHDINDSYKLRGILGRLDKGRIVVLVSRLPYKCPAAPYETAFLIDYLMRRRGVRARATANWKGNSIPISPSLALSRKAPPPAATQRRREVTRLRSSLRSVLVFISPECQIGSWGARVLMK